MNLKQKKFWKESLPKFILREQGRGFAMEEWIEKYAPLSIVYFDGVDREVPVCGTIACIGGSAELLLSKHKGFYKKELVQQLGLTDSEAEGLFYNWGDSGGGPCGGSCGWPRAFVERYAEADTPIKKARVAAALCKLVGRTEGKCLHRAEE